MPQKVAIFKHAYAAEIVRFIQRRAIIYLHSARSRAPPAQLTGYVFCFATKQSVRQGFLPFFLLQILTASESSLRSYSSDVNNGSTFYAIKFFTEKLSLL